MERIGEVITNVHDYRVIKWNIPNIFSILPKALENLFDNIDSSDDDDDEDDLNWQEIKKIFTSLVSGKISSPSFLFAGATWHMRVEYSVEGSKVHGRFCLCRETPGAPIGLGCTIGTWRRISRERESDFDHIFVKENEESGTSEDYTLTGTVSFLKDAKPSGVISVFCILKTVDPIDDPMSEKLPNDLKELMLSGNHSDTTIKVLEEELKLHRSILSARSPYFDGMFKTEMKEKTTGIVNIEDCKPEVFRSFIHFVYTGRVDKLSAENVCELYEVAGKYQESQLKEMCLRFMMKTTCVDSFCDYIALALKHEEKELFQITIEEFNNKPLDIVRSVKWQNFLVEYPTQANELFIKTLSNFVKETPI